MNRDLLYSLGLALAAWPPLVCQAPNLEPEDPPAIHAGLSAGEPLSRADDPAILEEDAGEPVTTTARARR